MPMRHIHQSTEVPEIRDLEKLEDFEMRNSQEMQLPFDFEFLPRFYEEKPQSPLDKNRNFSNSKSSFSNVNQS